jgi:hypothetical protein
MTQVPSAIVADEQYGMPTTGMAPGLALLFNDRLYERCKDVARIMAGAKGFTPPHLLDNQMACFGVVQMSITWRLTPQLVAASTYATPGGKIGYEGKLIQAILENSGKLEGGVEYELIGDWNRVRGKHKKATSAKGHEYFVPDWRPEDEEGLGVIVRAKVRGEKEPREMEPFWLRSCWPRNSTLWATRPEQQIKYTACRAFANTVAPGILMGVPFDSDADQGTMIDVTPSRPVRSDFDRPQQNAAEDTAGSDAPKTEEPQQEQEMMDDKAPVEDPAVPEAYELGRNDRRKGISLKDYPSHWKSENKQALVDARAAGWQAMDEETKAKLRGSPADNTPR